MDRRLYPVGFLAAFVLAALYLASGGSAPEGQPPVADLRSGLAPLQEQFNAAAANMRVILLVSHTCPYCLRGAADFQRVLERHADAPVAVFAVWQPVLPTDWGKPASAPLRRLHDPRVRQYWDPQRSVASALRDVPSGPKPGCCWSHEVPWDAMAVYKPGTLWGETLPEPVMFDGIIMDVSPRFEQLLSAPQ